MRPAVLLIVTVLVPLLTPLALFVLFAYAPRAGSDFERRYRHIATGMTAAEVRRIVRFDGARQTSIPGLWQKDGRTVPFVRGEVILLWEKDGEEIWIGFEQDRVVSKYFHDSNHL